MKRVNFTDIIRADLKWTRLALEGTDETDLFIAAYHCQQAVEKICGYIVQRLGIPSIRTHSINKWVDYLQNNGVVVPDLIVKNADEITEWESKSRYNINFYAVRQCVARVAEAAVLWLAEIEGVTCDKRCHC